MASELAPGRVLRFGATERRLHTIHASAFVVMFGSGLVLYLPMLAHAMDGAPLARKHGAPARLVMPQMYGYKGVKWVNRIVVTDRVTDGYWQQRGYDRDAWIGGSNGR